MYELWYHSHHILSIDPFDMKSMSIKFDNDILTSFSQAFKIGCLIYVLMFLSSRMEEKEEVYFYRPEASHFTGNEDIIIK